MKFVNLLNIADLTKVFEQERRIEWDFLFFLRRIKIIRFDWRKNDLRKKKIARYRL